MATTNLFEHRGEQASLKNWGDLPDTDQAKNMAHSVVLHCGWGRLIFGQTFDEPKKVARLLEAEAGGERDVAFYVRDPHLVIAAAPQTTFLDPSHSFRLAFADSGPASAGAPGLAIRPATGADEDAINRLYRARAMVPIRPGFCATLAERPAVTVLVAEEAGAGAGAGAVGVVMGVDHRIAFSDADNGSSLWALSVDPQVARPGVGKALVQALAERFRGAGRSFMDLSVMHDNNEAIALYRKLGFKRIPVYCIKRKNPINEKLFVGPKPEAKLNIYARIIVDEALRRGIEVAVESAEAGLFRLTLGGRSVACRESLSELTSAVAMSRCDDKALTRLILERAGLHVPEQMTVAETAAAHDFLARHRRVVVKPVRGEQGKGVAVDLRTPAEVDAAVEAARRLGNEVVIEEFVDGQDLRIIVIDNQVVAAAVRRPASVRGDGIHTVDELIDKQSRRRAAATGGESRIPRDAETERCVRAGGHRMTDVLAEGEMLAVRKTANLHGGGTIHDVTGALHPALAEAAVEGARALEIPVVGFDFMVADPAGPDYVVIEANERPGLANHEPQPTAERFIDLLFPQTRARRAPAPRAD